MERALTRVDVGPDFTISFPADCQPEDIKKALNALADYYRACGGIGLVIEFDDAVVLEPQATR